MLPPGAFPIPTPSYGVGFWRSDLPQQVHEGMPSLGFWGYLGSLLEADRHQHDMLLSMCVHLSFIANLAAPSANDFLEEVDQRRLFIGFSVTPSIPRIAKANAISATNLYRMFADLRFASCSVASAGAPATSWCVCVCVCVCVCPRVVVPCSVA